MATVGRSRCSSGIYRSENVGDDWIDISEGLPSRFGFSLAAHPHDGNTIYVIPAAAGKCCLIPGGTLAI
jgi:hypothetical protein